MRNISLSMKVTHKVVDFKNDLKLLIRGLKGILNNLEGCRNNREESDI